jgi:hypothetical protein
VSTSLAKGESLHYVIMHQITISYGSASNDGATWIATLALLISCIGVYVTYRHHESNRKSEMMKILFLIRERYWSLIGDGNLLDSLEDNKDPNLSFNQQIKLVGIFEEVNILRKRKVLDDYIVFNFFGYFAKKTYDNRHLSKYLHFDNDPWREFKAFVKSYEAFNRVSRKKSFLSFLRRSGGR